jgi:hypothetical protein
VRCGGFWRTKDGRTEEDGGGQLVFLESDVQMSSLKVNATCVSLSENPHVRWEAILSILLSGGSLESSKQRNRRLNPWPMGSATFTMFTMQSSKNIFGDRPTPSKRVRQCARLGWQLEL